MTLRLLRVERAFVALLVACTVVALAGYATFGLHPQLIGSNAEAARAYALAIVGFPRLHIALGFLALVPVVVRAASRGWLASLILLYGVSLASELLGTSVGWPFGPYHYTDALGPKWFGLVPLLIPLSWCTMTVAAFVMARRVFGVRGRLTTIAGGAVLLIAWDLALDPAMSRLTPYWVWAVPGPYFGMPWLNLVGWFATGAVLHAILVTVRAQDWVDARLPSTTRAMTIIYAANLALPLGMTLAAGLPVAAGASVGALLLLLALTRRRPGIAGIVRPSQRAEAVR